MKKHKGQSVVEFALMLPLFLFIMFGIIYTGMMFHDYTTLSNIARSSAREASVSGTGPESSGRYTEIESHYLDQFNLMTNFYKPVPVGGSLINVKQDESGFIKSTIIMQLNISGFFVDMILPRTFGVQYYMRKDPFTTGTSSGSS